MGNLAITQELRLYGQLSSLCYQSYQYIYSNASFNYKCIFILELSMILVIVLIT